MSRPGPRAHETPAVPGATFSEQTLREICDGLADGTPLSLLCKRDGMPSRFTVFLWQKNNPEAREEIRNARELGYDRIAHRLRGVAAGDETLGSTGDVRRDKLIVWTDLELLKRWDPTRYGDKVEHSGAIAQAPPDLATFTEQLVTQVTVNRTLAPVLTAWARDLISRLEAAP